MRVRSKYGRQKRIAATPIAPAAPKTYPAPVRGWVQNENVMGMQPGGAYLLQNFWAYQDDVRARGGCVERVDLGSPVRSLFSYRVSAGSALFAATDSALYDTSDGSTAVGSLTSGDFSSVQYGTAGGDFLIAVNGADAGQIYDGTSWAAWSITGVSSDALSQVWSYASRIWAIEAGTLSAWYLGGNAISGPATEFSLAGVFDYGGSLLFGAKWSVDAGDGLDDKCVFVTTEGEVAIYEGSDPSSVSTFAKAALYKMPKPLGKRAFVSAGGDLLIATEGGLIGLSSVMRADMAAVEANAVSRNIDPYWSTASESMTARSWELLKDRQSGQLLVSQPQTVAGSEGGLALSTNLITGAWSQVTGWDVQCLAEFDGRSYFGSLDGGVYLADEGGTDNGLPYIALSVGQFEFGGQPGTPSTMIQARANVLTNGTGDYTTSAWTDREEQSPVVPEYIEVAGGSVWDSAKWDEAVWDDSKPVQVRSFWQAVGMTGETIAPVVAAGFSSAQKVDFRLQSIDAQMREGARVA